MQYYRDEPALTDSGAIVEFFASDNSVLFTIKKKQKTGKAAANGRKDTETIVSLKYLNNFWSTFEMTLINCETNLILT